VVEELIPNTQFENESSFITVAPGDGLDRKLFIKIAKEKILLLLDHKISEQLVLLQYLFIR
jgi:hypothetical protein